MARRIISEDEEDAYTGWRRYLHWKPGQLAAVKRRTHKRERREARAEIERDRSQMSEHFGP